MTIIQKFLSDVRERVAGLKKAPIAVRDAFIDTILPKVIDLAARAEELELENIKLQRENKRLSDYCADLLLENPKDDANNIGPLTPGVPDGFQEVEVPDDPDQVQG